MKYLGILAVLLMPAAAAAQTCPGVDPATGYPVYASSDTPQVDTVWLSQLARAAAYRWRVPSERRNVYEGWERVQRRILPPEPRWADDWRPEEKHTAALRLTIYRDARSPRAELVERSGDERFDNSLRSIAAEPMPGSPAFPSLPVSAPDSVVVDLSLGAEPQAEHVGVARFAAAQTRIELDRRSLEVRPPVGHTGPFPRTTVKYDILPDGRVDPSSFEFVRSPGRRYESVVAQALLDARFTAPTSNCRPVAQTVVQTFGR